VFRAEKGGVFMLKSTNARTEEGSCYINRKIIQNGAKGKKVYFGTGLASSREESRGFGFELLIPVLTSLILMKRFGADGVLHEIGTVGFNISEKQRGIIINDQLSLIAGMTRSLNIEDVYRVGLSHSYHDSDLFKSILQDVKMKMNLFSHLPNFNIYGNYTMIQIAQMKYLYTAENTVIKVGWIVGNKPLLDEVDAGKAEKLINQGHLDEYYFDSLYRYVFPDDEFSFIYTPAGMDITNGRKYAPYTVTKSQHRPLLAEPIEPYLAKIPDSKHKREALKSYEKSIVDNWEYFFGGIKTFDGITKDEKLISKLQFIQDKVLGLHPV
jgi:hypothetical protein